MITNDNMHYIKSFQNAATVALKIKKNIKNEAFRR